MYVKYNSLINRDKNHGYNTRNSDFAVGHNKKIFETKPAFAGKKLFSRLPDELRNTSNINSFKRKPRDWLVEQCFYSIQELLEGY